jgi:hypothetical protein
MDLLKHFTVVAIAEESIITATIVKQVVEVAAILELVS